MNIFKWKFQNEPLYRWFIFVVAMGIFLAVWAQVVKKMK